MINIKVVCSSWQIGGTVAFIGLKDSMVVGNWKNFNYKE
jgi:hypothetical protein